MTRRLQAARTTRLACAWWLALCLVACPSTDSQSTLRDTNQTAVSGTLSVQIPFDAISVSELAYTVTRSGKPERQGRFVVDGETYLRALVGGLAPGSDLMVTLRGDARWRATGLTTSCVAINAFAIFAGQTSALAMMLTCDAAPAGATAPAGAAAGGNICPVIQAIHAIPTEAPVGSDVVLKAEVSDLDEGPERLHYAWSADYGAFTEATSARALFRCTEPGDATISLAASDGDPMCPNQGVFVYVTCLESQGSQLTAGQGAGSSIGAAGRVSAPSPSFAVAGSAAQGGRAASSAGAGTSGQRTGGTGGANAAVAAVSGAGAGAAQAGGSGGSGRMSTSGRR
jgi:hypothetical protein